jgi:hypothetical protein
MSRIHLPGAVHMHTTYSDGSATYPELIAAARAAGLKWVIVTDHDTLEGLPFAGWHDDLLVIVGHEITPDRNHFLALNCPTVVDSRLPPQQFIDEVYQRGGFGIIAHPDEQVKNSFKDIYRWDDWSVDGPSQRDGRPVGIELWNIMSDWAEHLTDRNKVWLAFFPQFGLSAPTPATLAWWDELNMSGKRTFGVGGVDAHGFKRPVPWGTLEVVPYRWIFRTLTNYLLLDEPLSRDAATATAQVYAALAAMRLYMVNRRAATPAGLQFAISSGGRSAQSGETLPLQGGSATVSVDVGADAYLRLIGNGAVVANGVRRLQQPVSVPGVYRVEAYWGGKPWIYSNPIFVTPDPAAAVS